jgi:acetylornithine deacetylase/succinyl-diaminopimelate desuccinylase-like protein
VAGFISRLEQIEPKTDSDLGSSSVAPTLIRTDQISPNVLPGEVWLTCDWRRLPAETKEEVRQVLQSIADRSLIPGATAEVLIPTFARKSFTGLTMEIPSDHPPFLLSQDEPAVQAAQSVLEAATGQPVEVGIWKFATDGGHFAEAGWTVIGYGPGEELLAHTIEESIAVADLAAAIRGNRELALHWTSATA